MATLGDAIKVLKDKDLLAYYDEVKAVLSLIEKEMDKRRLRNE